jgi:hypothetical protein
VTQQFPSTVECGCGRILISADAYGMGDKTLSRPTPSFIHFFALLVVLLLVEITAVKAASVSDAPTCRSEGKRFALLIGNQDYRGALTPLENPRRDTEAFSKLLCSNGFTVYRYSDLDIAGFDRALSQFVEATRGLAPHLSIIQDMALPPAGEIGWCP